MKLSTLRCFTVVAQYGSFTKASERLPLSQPTLSRKIQELEAELGTRLFLRENRELRLTENGRLLLREAAAILERCDRIPELLHANHIDGKGRNPPEVLKIGYQKFFNTQWIYQAINQIRQEETDSDILLTQNTVSELKEGLATGQFDAVFTLQAYFEQASGYRVLPFRRNRLLLVVPELHPLAGAGKVKIRELREEKFVLLNRQYSPIIVDYVVSLCVRNGFSPNTVAYVNSAEEGLELAAEGKAISFLHSEMRMEGLERKYRVKFLDIDEKEVNLAFAVVFRD